MIFIKQNEKSNIVINLKYVVNFRIPKNTIPNASLEIRFKLLEEGDVVFHYNSEEQRVYAIKEISKIIKNNLDGVYLLEI